MAVKIVYLPVGSGSKITKSEQATYYADAKQATDYLDSLLNDGYQIVSDHKVEVPDRVVIVLICHKISVPKAEDDAADGS